MHCESWYDRILQIRQLKPYSVWCVSFSITLDENCTGKSDMRMLNNLWLSVFEIATIYTESKISM